MPTNSPSTSRRRREAAAPLLALACFLMVGAHWRDGSAPGRFMVAVELLVGLALLARWATARRQGRRPC